MVHKIDTPGAGAGNTWVEESPGVPKTTAGAKWFNMVQAELIGILEAAGIAPDDANDGQVSAALDILFGSLGAAALKNRLINGAVQIWQRGDSVRVGNVEAYTADRWAAIADQVGAGVGDATVSRELFPFGQIDVPGDPPFFMRWTQSIGSTAAQPFLVQKIEDVHTLSDGFATASFYGRAAAGSLITIRLVQSFGVGGSADVVAGSLTVPITTGWARRAATFAVPSIAGKTIGPGSSLRFELVFPAAAEFTFDLVDLQVEPGENATPFERRTLQLEYALAARFFEKSYPIDVLPGTAAAAPEFYSRRQTGHEVANDEMRYVQLGTRFRVRKRAIPSVTWYAVEGGGALAGAVSQYTTPPTFSENAAVNATLDTSEAATGHPVTLVVSGDRHARAHWTADAEL